VSVAQSCLCQAQAATLCQTTTCVLPWVPAPLQQAHQCSTWAS